MAFYVIFNDSEAACAVCSNDSGEAIHFARIILETSSMKRSCTRRSADNSESGGCTMNISVWDTTTIFSSRSVAKTLNLTYRYQHHFQCWQRARILAIEDVLEVPKLIHSTFVVLAAYGWENRFGTILCRIADTGTEVLRVVDHVEEPINAVIMKGPSLLLLTSSGVMFYDFEGKKSIIYSCDAGQNAVEHWSIRSCTDDDAKALISTYSPCRDFSGLEISVINWKGTIVNSSYVQNRFRSRSSLLTASLHRGVFLFSTAEGYLYAFDYNVEDEIWRTQHSSVAKNVRNATVHRDLVILTTLDESEDVYFVNLRNSANPVHSPHEVRKLFTPNCEQSSETDHKHLYAFWKEILFKVSNENGSCCGTMEIEWEEENQSLRPSSGSPSLLQIEKNLESRLQRGLDRFLEQSERITDKKEMLNRVLALLTEEIGSSTTKPFIPVFKYHLEHVASIRNRRESGVGTEGSLTNSLTSEHRKQGSKNMSCLEFSTPGVLKLVNNTCRLDSTGNFLTVQTEIAFPESADERDANTLENLSMKLNFSCSDRIPTVWNFNEVSFKKGSQSYSLYGFAPLAVFADGSKMSTPTCSARVNFSNGRSQIVGLFTIASLLSSNNHTEKTKEGTFTADPNFKHCFHVIAWGLKLSQIEKLSQGENIIQKESITTAENLTRFTLNCISRNDIATTISRLAIRAGDKVKFCSSPEPSRSALYDIDTAVNLLQDERKFVRVIGSQKNAYGYTPADIVKVLEMQIAVDEAFGVVEEQQLWF